MNRILKIESAVSGNEKIGLVNGPVTRFVLPLFYLDSKVTSQVDITPHDKRKLKLIVKAWRKYSRSLPNSLSTGGTDQTSGDYNFDVAISIVEDFINNGIYLEYEKNCVIRKEGRINFPETMKKCSPIYTEEGPVYLDFITQIKKINDEEVIRYVQTIALNSISKDIGWLIGFNVLIPVKHSIHSTHYRLIYDLLVAKQSSHNTRKIILIDLLMKYLKNSIKNDSEVSKEIFVGTAYRFWEELVRNVFGNLTPKEVSKNFYVRHAYNHKKNKRIFRSMDPLMPDTIFLTDGTVLVIDAKYYSKSNLPMNDDISKQFIYQAKAELKYGKDYKCYSIFVLPTDQHTAISDFEVLFDIDVNTDMSLLPIKLMYANVEEVISKYLTNEKIYIIL